MPLTAAQVAQAVISIDPGLKQHEVATVLNVPRSLMQYALIRYQDTVNKECGDEEESGLYQ